MSNATIRLAASLIIAGMAGCGGQRADPDARQEVSTPAWVATHPRVLFDGGHHNAHPATGRFRPFVELLEADGFRVTIHRARFTAESLNDADVLVIVNAAGSKPVRIGALDLPTGWKAKRGDPAFSPDECERVAAWVRNGGSLLLVADHFPFGSASRAMATALGVEMSNGFTNASNCDPAAGDSSQLVFTRDTGLLAEHPVANGRGPAERVNRIVSFTGQSLAGPPGSGLLLLPDGAYDYFPAEPEFEVKPALGTQGLAFEPGAGRAVVLGEAAMLTAQVDGDTRFGFQMEGNDNRQFVLNVMRWLSRAY